MNTLPILVVSLILLQPGQPATPPSKDEVSVLPPGVADMEPAIPPPLPFTPVTPEAPPPKSPERIDSLLEYEAYFGAVDPDNCVTRVSEAEIEALRRSPQFADRTAELDRMLETWAELEAQCRAFLDRAPPD